MKKYHPIFGFWQKVALMSLDSFLFLLSGALTFWLRLGSGPMQLWKYRTLSGWEIGVYLFLLVLLLGVSYVFGAYDFDRAKMRLIHVFLPTILAIGLVFSVFIGINYFLSLERSGFFGRGISLGTFLAFIILECFLRWIIWLDFIRRRKRNEVLFLVTREEYEHVCRDLNQSGFQGVAYFLLEEEQNSGSEGKSDGELRGPSIDERSSGRGHSLEWEDRRKQILAGSWDDLSVYLDHRQWATVVVGDLHSSSIQKTGEVRRRVLDRLLLERIGEGGMSLRESTVLSSGRIIADRSNTDTMNGLYSGGGGANRDMIGPSSSSIVDLMHFYEGAWKKIPVFYLQPHWFIFGEGFQLMGSPMALRLKRLVDLVMALGLLGLIWPLMVLVGLCIYLEDGGSVFYRQRRTGRNRHIFTIFKFRSMRKDAEKQGGAQWARSNDDRITKVGKWIRKFRLDELPQLFNVLRGEMSFVGPRPERPEFNEWLEKEIPFYPLRHAVNPGITGWAQIMYPYGASREDAYEKLQYDLYYIKNHSGFLDTLIFFKTISVVVLGRGR